MTTDQINILHGCAFLQFPIREQLFQVASRVGSELRLGSWRWGGDTDKAMCQKGGKTVERKSYSKQLHQRLHVDTDNGVLGLWALKDFIPLL